MELVTGQIVFSRKGRDVTKLYAVVGTEPGRALLADGAKYPLGAPKRKNLRHIQPTGAVLPAFETETDLKLKSALRRYDEGRGGQQGG